MEVVSGVILLIGVAMAAVYIHKALFGKCSYCGSKDIVPDEGLFFYCNDCKRKS